MGLVLPTVTNLSPHNTNNTLHEQNIRWYLNCDILLIANWLNFNSDYQFNLLMTPYIAKTQKSKLIFNTVILMVLGQVAKLNSIPLYFHHVRYAD